jgi:hypothetical protein
MLEYHNNAIEATAGLFSMTTSHKVDSIPLIQLNFIIHCLTRILIYYRRKQTVSQQNCLIWQKLAAGVWMYLLAN